MRVNGFRLFATVMSAAVIILVFAGSAFGTPPSGIVSGPILARGDFVDDVDVKIKLERDGSTVVSNAPAAGEVVVQEITIAPGGTTGWHSHPGPVVVIVKAGTLTYVREAGGECIQTPYPAGTAFVDPGQGHAHTAFNLGAANLVLVATYFDVPVGGSPRHASAISRDILPAHGSQSKRPGCVRRVHAGPAASSRGRTRHAG